MTFNTRAAIRTATAVGSMLLLMLVVNSVWAYEANQSTTIDQNSSISVTNGDQSIVIDNGQVTITNGDNTVSANVASASATSCPTPAPTPTDGTHSSVSVTAGDVSISITNGQVRIVRADGICLAVA